MSNSQYWVDRGNPWDYDPGPPKNLKWARLFSETPNYRQLSNTALGMEKFRWHFGPMYYRGRLTSGDVKVIVIGQEGAQDESLAHRSFVGGTGSRMQHFLKSIGIDRSYLFLNTFVYPIVGQYWDDIKWLAQDPRSPIVKHRHTILNYALERNDVHLVVAVGTAAKETVQTWVQSRGGTCPDGTLDLSTCTSQVLDANTKVVGVLHPGGVATGDLNEIKASFQAAIDNIRNWATSDPGWLPADAGMSRDLTLPYIYDSAPIPFRDLPFGLSWRLGRGGTSSNRMDAQQSIQIFSENGKYNNNGDIVLYSDLAPGTKDGYSEEQGDVPYEPPVKHYKDYDQGPGTSMARLFQGCSTGFAWPDFTTLGVTAHPSLGYNAIYRGRPKQARFLILADQESQNDLFLCRALTGNGGQHIQAYLKALGITASYCMIRSLPADTMDLTVTQRKTITQNNLVENLYREIVRRILKENKTKVILTFGPVAADLVTRLNTNTIPVISLKSWLQSGATADWQAAIPGMQNLVYAKDISPSFVYLGERIPIPAYDLPYGTLKWQASSGDRARRAKDGNDNWSPDYYKFIMPDWAFTEAPRPLSSSEQQAIQHHP